MTAYAPLTLGQTFGKLADEQAQQQTAYLLLKGKAVEAFWAARGVCEAALAALDALGPELDRESEYVRALDAEAATYADNFVSKMAALSLYIKLLEKSK